MSYIYLHANLPTVPFKYLYASERVSALKFTRQMVMIFVLP